MAALPHAQPTIMEVEGSKRPEQREVALSHVVADKAKKEMACVSLFRRISENQKLNNNTPSFFESSKNELLFPFQGVIVDLNFL